MRTQKRGNQIRGRIVQLVELRRSGYPLKPRPTVREIAVAIDRSVSSTHRHLVILRKMGALDYDPGEVTES